MSAMPAISVIIPVYRGRRTVKRAIDSVSAQSVIPVEIVVVDNDPEDGLDAFLPRAPCPVQLLRESRRGAAYARNLGMAAAQGTHYAFLDCDDEWTPGYLAAMCRAISQRPYSYLFVGASVLSVDGHSRHQSPPRFGRRALKRILVSNAIPTSGVVVNGAAARTYGGFQEGLSVPAGCEDWALWLILLRNGDGVAVPDAVVIRYETRGGARDDGSSVFYRDMEAAARHALGDHAPKRLVRAARAGMSLRRGTELLREGRRREARLCFRSAVSLFPTCGRAWAWLTLALLPRSLERAARKLRRSGPGRATRK